MSNQKSASKRINALLDENSFVEIGGICNCQKLPISTCSRQQTPADGVITGYGVIDGQPGICLQSGCFRTGRLHG